MMLNLETVAQLQNKGAHFGPDLGLYLEKQKVA